MGKPVNLKAETRGKKFMRFVNRHRCQIFYIGGFIAGFALAKSVKVTKTPVAEVVDNTKPITVIFLKNGEQI